MQEKISETEKSFLGRLGIMMEHMALLTEAMTQEVRVHRTLIEDTASFRATLLRIEDKIDIIMEQTHEEEEIN